MSVLADYGWTEEWARRFVASGLDGRLARVVEEHRGVVLVRTETEVVPARVPGRLRHQARSASDLPAVGDWIVLDEAATVVGILPRASAFYRKVPGKRTDEQVVGANIDTVWVVSPLGADRNPSRLERYTTMVWESGASPVVVLTKSDLIELPETARAEVAERIVGVPVHAVSAVDGDGIEGLRSHVVHGRTVALLGPSGAGKSTLINHLAGEEVMRTADVRAGDGKGRHTTTHRQLVLLRSGGLLLDTPGMREIQLWSGEDGLERGFADIEELAAGCRFGDCLHETEPGCAVRGAIAEGRLDAERLESFRKLGKELAYLERRQDIRAEIEERQRWKQITKGYRRWIKKQE